MLTYYCPHCWHTLEGKATLCPYCGYDLSEFESLSYPQKLIQALHHPIPERRVIAAQVLGELRRRLYQPLRLCWINYTMSSMITTCCGRC